MYPMQCLTSWAHQDPPAVVLVHLFMCVCWCVVLCVCVCVVCSGPARTYHLNLPETFPHNHARTAPPAPPQEAKVVAPPPTFFSSRAPPPTLGGGNRNVPPPPPRGKPLMYASFYRDIRGGEFIAGKLGLSTYRLWLVVNGISDSDPLVNQASQ